MNLHHIYWWNLENLFDIEDSSRRSEFLKKQLSKELIGWTQQVLDRKLSNLTSIISNFNNNGPDIFGVCEVENLHVLELLKNRLNTVTGKSYSILHVDSLDKRGIDTALLFDSALYSSDGDVFTLRITKRSPTRDLFQVHLTTNRGNKLIFILNHWPARSAGVFKSEPYRIMVAENLSFWIERIHEEQGKNASIILMGDFNDNPYDRSITEYLQSSSIKKRVENARNHFMYNLMYEFLGTQLGTYVYGNEVNILDQFLVSKSIISNSSNHPFKVNSVRIVDDPRLTTGEYKKPIRFSRPSKSDYNQTGFSDHLPIELVIEEKDSA